MEIDEDWEDLRPVDVKRVEGAQPLFDVSDDWWHLKGYKPLPPYFFHIRSDGTFGTVLWRVVPIQRRMMVSIVGPPNARPTEHVFYRKERVLWHDSNASQRDLTPMSLDDRPHRIPRIKLFETLESAIDRLYEIRLERMKHLEDQIKYETERLAKLQEGLLDLTDYRDEWMNSDFEGFISEALKT